MALSDPLLFKRRHNKPFIVPCQGTAAPDAVTTPDVLQRNGTLYFYVGAVDGDKERLICLTLTSQTLLEGKTIEVPNEARIILNAGPNDFDCYHVFDPAAIFWSNAVFLYYSAIGKGEDSIGLAISEDGFHFTKQSHSLFVGRSPEAVVKDGLIYLYYVKNDIEGRYSIYAMTSRDGLTFETVSEDPLLAPGCDADWDGLEVTTPRILPMDNMFYMLYAGLSRHDVKDIPRAFGLARSKDLIHWEKYSRNPVFRCGEVGEWDDGAIWFGTLLLLDETVYLIYEGGRLENVLNKTPALTQVGLASLSQREFLEAVSNW